MSVFYAYPNPKEDIIALIHHAVHSSVTFLNTADVFDPLNNETVLEKVPSIIIIIIIPLFVLCIV
jgi:aryl-alcohol dehydrogenase-like predicted oxidoreductase